MLSLGFAAFLLFGFVLVVTGTCQQDIAADLGLDFERFGLLGASLSLGIGTGVLAAGLPVDRFARRPLFLAATVICAGALLSVEHGMGLERAIVHVFAMGFGGGLYDTLLNALTVERYGERSARPLALLHGGATLGAVVSPVLIEALQRAGGDWVATFRWGGGAFLLLSLWVACTPLPRPRPVAGRPGSDRADGARRVLIALVLVGFAYVGVESGITLFAVPYARDVLALSETRGRAAISVFWLGLLAGRVVLAFARGLPGAGALAWMGALGAGTLVAGVASGVRAPELVLGVLGLAIGGVFPLMVSLAGRALPHAPGVASALVAGFGSLGGFAIPWLIGALADATGVAFALACLALACAAITAAARLARAPGPV